MSERLIDPRIKLRHLACFLEVARLRSVVRAADALGISQPAATKTIQDLEAILARPLFDRARRKLQLTAFGEVFYRYAATAIAALRQGIDAARTGAESALVRIGALPTVSARILPEAVQTFTTQQPGVHTRIITGPNDYLLARLRTGDVDLVIGRMAEPDAMLGLAFEHLYSERVAMVVRPGHPLLGRPDFTLKSIEPHQVLMPTPGSVIRPLVERLLRAHGLTALRDEVETISDAFGRSYVRETDSVWIISEGVVARDVADGQLALLPVDTTETLGPVGFTTRADAAPGLAAQALMQAVRDIAARLRP